MTAGVPQGEDPHVRKDPQTLTYRDCLGTTGHPLRERKREWGQTRAELALSTPTRVPSTASSLCPTNIQTEEEMSPPTGRVAMCARAGVLIRSQYE